MNHYTTPNFWSLYHHLPAEIQRLADKSFALLKEDSRHPSLMLKKVGNYWAVRVGLHYRALAIETQDGLVWFWIGSHAKYDEMVG